MSDIVQLATALASLARLDGRPARLVGIGWATVDAERTLRSLVGAPGTEPGPEVPEPILGARAHVALLGGTALVVLEPSTEGRLAAALARRGEGLAALYLEAPRPTGSTRVCALGRPGRALAHDRPWGPFLVLVDPADR